MAGQKRKFAEIKKPSERLNKILDYMGFGEQSKANLEVVKEYIFELGLRKMVAIVKPGETFETMVRRQRGIYRMNHKENKQSMAAAA